MPDKLSKNIPNLLLLLLLLTINLAFSDNSLSGEVSTRTAHDKPSIKVAADPLQLLEEPGIDSKIVTTTPLFSSVRILGYGPEVVVNDKKDKWVNVSAARCADTKCTKYLSGWVLDSKLASEDRFRPVTQRGEGIIIGYDRFAVYFIQINDNGSFKRYAIGCTAAKCSISVNSKPDCSKIRGTPEGQYCVISGQLFRYGNLVRTKTEKGKWDKSVYLKVNESQEYCLPKSGRDNLPKMCERSGVFNTLGAEPRDALTALLEMRSKKIALVAADMLNIRDNPSEMATIVNRAPAGSYLKVLDENGPPITINSIAGKWAYVTVDWCADFWKSKICEYGINGWVPSHFLGFESRFLPVTKWRSGRVGGYGGDSGFYYYFKPDGSVDYVETCGHYNDPDWCRYQGKLYRYRSVVLARFPKKQHAVFVVDDKDRLCLPVTEGKDLLYEDGSGRSIRCDR